MALQADILVFTEFYPKGFERQFRTALENGGWAHQRMSMATSERANRIFVASKLPLTALDIELPTFDQQFPANLLAVQVPGFGLSLLSLRMPIYSEAALRSQPWSWLGSALGTLRSSPCIVAGDLNIEANARKPAGRCLRRILATGWHRATPNAPTYFGRNGSSEIDHILATDRCALSESVCINQAGGYALAGSATALSDHAALLCRIEIPSGLQDGGRLVCSIEDRMTT
jgi:endonuclease/exonuclease/phosphatase family metal-dependent hydrolase